VRVLVTGGAGFIGHHLVRGLIAQGDEVRVLDDFSTGDMARLDPLRTRLTIVKGSILDRARLDEAAESCEVIFHEAAIASVAQSIRDPLLANAVNVTGTIEVMLAAARHRVRRVVFAGSASVYGTPESLPCLETFRPAPESPYGVTKLAGEHYLTTLGTLHGVETAILRYFNVFGPGQDPASEYAAVVPRFIKAVLDGRQPVIYGTGSASRDFIYVDNVVAANLLAARASSPSGITCNIAAGTTHTILELLAAVCTAATTSVDPKFSPERLGDIAHSYADITLARDLLGYEVVTPFHEGIQKTVDWYSATGTGLTAAARLAT
jgi:UDP-glucose 4-epimerase